jgi:predicted transcriptional regulator of viral defense system
MNFVSFQNKLFPYPVFSLNDISKIAPGFNRIQLDRWEKKGYLKKIRRGYYTLFGGDVGKDINRNFLFYAANKIHSPSYVSLESALKFHNLIPEEIFQITSVGTKKTSTFATPIGNFNYRRIKPSLFFGYVLTEPAPNLKILLAEPEKAVLDYLYLNSRLKTVDDFKEMRINADEFHKKVDLYKFLKYLEAFENKALSVRVEKFLTAISK